MKSGQIGRQVAVARTIGGIQPVWVEGEGVRFAADLVGVFSDAVSLCCAGTGSGWT